MRVYPFKPTSTTKLQPGDFWALPLADGRFGCGRVITIKADAGPGQRSMLLAGVMDWVGTCPRGNHSPGAVAPQEQNLSASCSNCESWHGDGKREWVAR